METNKKTDFQLNPPILVTVGEVCVREAEIVQAFQNCRGWKIRQTISIAEMAEYVFSENASELLECVNHFEKPEISNPLMAYENTKSRNHAFAEVVRLLHNFVSASKSHVEHTRRTMREILPQEVMVNYQQKINTEFANNPLVQFVQDLRDYTLHRQNTFLGYKFEANSSETAARLVIFREHLESWNGWNQWAKQFLQAAPKEILINDVVGQYLGKVQGFTEWLKVTIEKTFQKDFQEVWNLQAELKELLVKRGIPV
jgi:hypothetical protein